VLWVLVLLACLLCVCVCGEGGGVKEGVFVENKGGVFFWVGVLLDFSLSRNFARCSREIRLVGLCLYQRK
jgi:hypothetical protein